MGADSEVWSTAYSLRQNAALLLRWGRAAEPSSDDLAYDCFVDQPKLVSGWLRNIRNVVSFVQTRENECCQLGGMGVEVEIDEVCFRARWCEDADGRHGVEWLRYIAAFERSTGRMVLKQLPVRFAKGAGQGGGGSLSPEELHSFIFRPGQQPLLRPGTIVHTDGAAAYRDLHWTSTADFPGEASEQYVADLTSRRPSLWRLENYKEVLEREAAERRDFRGRSEEWAAKYASLQLTHTSVSHSNKKGGLEHRQFVAVRRCRLPPEVAAHLKDADPFLVNAVTWRKAGTQTVDGYWRTLRQKAGHRSVNTKLREAVHNLVLVHQWSFLAGPGTDFLKHIGSTLQKYRALRAADVQAAQEPAGSDSVDRCEAVARGRQWMEQDHRRACRAKAQASKAVRASAVSAAKRQAVASEGVRAVTKRRRRVCASSSDE